MPARLLLLLLLLFPAAAVEAGDRPAMLPVEEHANWQAIGRLNRGGYRSTAMCSATLIAPDLVLTAAHCVTGPDGTALPAEGIRFVAGWLRGAHAGTAEAAAIAVPRDWSEGIAAGAMRIGADIATITLAAPLPGIAPIQPARPLPGAAVRVLGYRWDRPHALSDSGACPATAAGAGTYRMTCAVSFGTSGAPVLQRQGDGWAVVGVVSGMGHGLSFFAEWRDVTAD